MRFSAASTTGRSGVKLALAYSRRAGVCGTSGDGNRNSAAALSASCPQRVSAKYWRTSSQSALSVGSSGSRWTSTSLVAVIVSA